MFTLEQFKQIAAAVGERTGWDFSRVKDAYDPTPWDYVEVVRRYLRPDHRVLDIGTAGGERFLCLAPFFDTGVGIDCSPDMIQTAHANRPPSLAGRVSFEVMRAEALRFPEASFDVVLNRHAPLCASEIVRVLRPAGYLITQQVGARNTHNICAVFGCGPGGQYTSDPHQEMAALIETFRHNGCAIIARAEYDVRYWFLDVASLVFWIKALPMPEDLDLERHWQQVATILQTFQTPRGIETNEHRELLIVQKR